MWFITFLGSAAGRAVSIALGAWLLVQGTLLPTLGGIVMTMAGVLLVVIGAAGVRAIPEPPRERKA